MTTGCLLFIAWMFTELPWQPNPPTITLPPGKPLYVEIGPGPGGASDFKSVLVLGVDPASHVSGTTSLFKKLAIQGQNHAGYVGAGKWYRFNNNQNPHRRHATQSGTWAGAATGTGPTTFTTSSNANLTEYMVGWTLQPDINAAVYLTITAVSGSTLNVAGAYASLGGQGKRFRIYAPPGTERFGKAAGTLDRYVAANSSRHLYMGYRYESPAAGVWDDINGTALKRQTGNNFTGLYYTLHRHYDPNLMRFTSPDPAAQFFYNLHTYGKNSPARYYDPDGEWVPLVIGGIAIGIAVAAIIIADAKPAYAPDKNWTAEDYRVRGEQVRKESNVSTMQVAPVTGDVNDLQAVFTGKDMYSSEQIGWGGRLVTVGAAALPVVSGGMLRKFFGVGGDIVTQTKKADDVVDELADAIPPAKSTPPPRSTPSGDDLAILKSIRRHSERLASGRAVSNMRSIQKHVGKMQAHVRAGRHGAAGSMFHSLSFRSARQAQAKGFLVGLKINKKRVSTPPGSRRKYRVPDYSFDGGGIYDLKPWRPDRHAYDATEQFQDIFRSTGTMPVPLYYRMR